MDQASLFGDNDHLLRPPPPSALPDPAEVRGKLHRVLDRLRGFEDAPWPERDIRYWRTVFPQMANWLPSDECLEIVAAFDDEVARLKLVA